MSQTRYQTIADDIAKHIATKDSGEQLPSWRSLVRQYNTSLRTISRVMHMLEAQGLIITRPGQGTYIKKRS